MGNEYSIEPPAEAGTAAATNEATNGEKNVEEEEAPPPAVPQTVDPPKDTDENAVGDDKDDDGTAAVPPSPSDDGEKGVAADTSTDVGVAEKIEEDTGGDKEADKEVEPAAEADEKELPREEDSASADKPEAAEAATMATEEGEPTKPTSTAVVEDDNDEEVLRARALAQFIEKYGADLTPEQIANITPEQVARLTHVGSKAPPALKPVPPRPIVEMREYELQPMYAHSYLHHTTAKADLRKSLSPLRLFAIPETGGQLNVATHLYHWRGGYQERNARKVDMASDEEWKEYIKKVQPALVSQKSTIFMEAPFVYEMEGVIGLGMGRAESTLHMGGRYSKDAVYEICRYKLKLGYDIIPKFLRLYEKGLPSKLDAEDSDPSTNLITLMYSTVGTLNEIVEVWRHGGGFDAMERSGAAAQGAKEWRESGEAISDLTLEVTRMILKPISFSPLL